MNAGQASGFVVMAAIGAVVGTIAVAILKKWLAGQITGEWIKAEA